MMHRAAELIAAAHGVPCVGLRVCYYCGAAADDSHPLILSAAFTDWWSVAHPSSEVICHGCAIAFDESRDMPGRDKPQKVRNWSWLVTAHAMTPLMDIASVRAACLAPPADPWALTIAVSGQKHLLFRAPANSGDGAVVAVQLETQTVRYTIDALHARLTLAKRIAAATGKMALTEPLNSGLVLRLLDALRMDDIADWFSRAAEPINLLAAHICPPKEECQREFPCAA